MAYDHQKWESEYDKAFKSDDEIHKLQEVIALYEKSLKESWPEGAKGKAFEYWNEARKLLNS